ncbi:MAG: nucleotidyltransferase domain-containing protein [Nitrosomonadales bacterium]|nr:nucleotidyltransferase domain-containing protein [Nitrosomonadales bacterium]
MSSLYTELSSSAQAAYAQLADAALATEHARSVADLSGSFSSKVVKGNKYWYYQYSEPSGKLRQVFVGPDNEGVRALVASKTQPPVSAGLGPLSGAAVAHGCAEVLPKHLRVIHRLAEYGFFRAGGLLVGTHAFLAYGNMLGVRWGDAASTQDIDFAHAGKNLSLALPANIEVQTRDAVESLAMGLLPVSGLSGKSGATFLSPRDPAFRLDFLTTLHRGGEKPYEHPQLHVMLQPLKFMEFSLQQVQQAVVFNRSDAVLVNVPHPARYALHKLLVYGEREGTFATKSGKDLQQAAALLAFFKEHRAWEAEEAWADLRSRGRGWQGRLNLGMTALNRQYPELEIKKWLHK